MEHLHLSYSMGQGNSYIEEPGLKTLVEAGVKSGRLTVKTRPETVDAFIIAVPTPLTKDKRADLSYVESAKERSTLLWLID